MQIIVMTSDGKDKIVAGFYYQWRKYFKSHWQTDIILCGFTPNNNYNFYSIGQFADYPANKWSDALIKVLDNVADDIFILMLDDYWLIRESDTTGIAHIAGYMRQFQNVIRFDLTTDRLYANPGKYAHGFNTYNTVGHLDIIKSDFNSQYHMSLWGAMWRRDLLKEILIPNETAQQIELNGTYRLAQRGDELLVLGTRQSPLKHANVIQNGGWNQDSNVGLPAIKEGDRQELKELGAL